MIGLGLPKSELIFLSNQDYKTQLEEKLGKVEAVVFKKIDELHKKDTVAYPEKHKAKFKDTVSMILEIYRFHSIGDRYMCYVKFRQIMEHLIPELGVTSTAYIKIVKGNAFYRIRPSSISEGKKDTSIFHIPFNLRYLVSNLRYNSPGIPCLYCGNNLATAEAEIPQTLKTYPSITDPTIEEELNAINFAVFRNSEDVTCLDLSFKELKNLEDRQKLPYLLLFPLIFSLHTKQNFSWSPTFRIEYLLPSSSVESSSLLENFNFVFPATYDEKEMHCQYLKKVFLGDFVNTYTDELYKCFGALKDIKPKIPELEAFALAKLG